MSLKSIEMQVALPRTHEAGKLQEQLQQRGQLHNDLAMNRLQKEEEKKKTTVIKQEQKDQVLFQNKGDGHSHHHQKHNEKKRSSKEKKLKMERHPYKGTVIDFNG